MTTFSEIIETISNFFPKGKKFDEAEYQESQEFQNLLELRQRYLDDPTFGRSLLQIFQTVFQGYAVVDWTNLRDANCYEYYILLHKDQSILDDDLQLIKTLGGKRTDLRLFVSILAKYYYFFAEETSYDEKSQKWSFDSVNNISTQITENINCLREKMKLEGYNELSKDVINTPVKGIETEFVQDNKVKVFHCLFTDLVTP